MALYNYINSSGTIVPDTGSVQTEVQNEYKATFGEDLVTTPDTPQGVLIVAESLARSAVLENNAMLANQINPNLAGGIFLDAILALTGMQRTPATYSVVSIVLNGIAGTIIPQGSQIRDTLNPDNIFQSVSAVTLAANGQAIVNFQSLVSGPVPVLSTTLWALVSAVLGWETATNNTPFTFTLGESTQSDATARNYRQSTIAKQSNSTAEAITSGLYATAGVRSLSFRENINNTTTVIDGVSMAPHSIYACIDGGLNTDIAATLTGTKSAGAAYTNGASATPVLVPYIVTQSGQTINVLFDRPDHIQILVKATVKQDAAIQDPLPVIKEAILAYAAGQLSGEPGLVVGASVSPFELAGAVNQVAPGLYIQKMEIALASSPTFVTTEIPMSVWQLAVISEANISVATV